MAAELPGRTPAQVMHFYRNHLDPNIKKGKWAQDEDDLLTAVRTSQDHLDTLALSVLHTEGLSTPRMLFRFA